MSLAPHINRQVESIAPSATLAINERSDQLRAQGRTIYKLGLGQSPFPVPERVVQALRDNAHQKDYLPVQGLPALREAISAYLNRVHEIDRQCEDIIIGPGSKELLFLTQFCYQAELLLPTPAWVTYEPQARAVTSAVRYLHTSAADGWCLSAAQLDAACDEMIEHPPRLLLLNYPNNPTGQIYEADQLAALADVARRHHLLVLSDEIYGDLHHQGGHLSFARFYPEGTIVSSGLSKWCGAGGWRLGFAAFPQQLHWLLKPMVAVASETFTAVSAPVQYAAIAAFTGGPDIDDYLSGSRQVLKALGGWCARQLRQSNIACCDPAASFYLFIDLEDHRDGLAARGIRTAPQLCEQLLSDTGVATLPGTCFGRLPEELTLRLSYVDFDGEAALRFVDASLADIDSQTLVERCCPQVVRAIRLLCQWAQGTN